MKRKPGEQRTPSLDYELGVVIPAHWREINHSRCGCRTFIAPGGCLVFIEHPVSLLRTTPGQPRFAYVLGDNVDLMAFTDDWGELLHSLQQNRCGQSLKPSKPGV